MLVIERVLDISEDAGGLPHAALAQEHDLEVVVLGLTHLSLNFDLSSLFKRLMRRFTKTCSEATSLFLRG